MSLKDEITQLRAEFDAHVTSQAGRARKVAEPVQDTAEAAATDSAQLEGLMETIGAALDDMSDEIEKFPKLTALAALGVGLALGVVIGRQLR
ncbi:hypothetical protein DFO80_108109 [Rhodobacter sp. 140A]|nr:hypothetical protein DFO80_108109 [Rhodobacter sp. 140A]